MLEATGLGEKCAEAMKDARQEWMRLRLLQRHIDGKVLKTWMPEGADAEYRDLLNKSGGPWLGFSRDAIAQGCIINGYENEDVWARVWRANGMDGRQGVSTKEAVGLGKSFLMLLPSSDGGVVMRPMSAHNTYAIYTDPWDEFPEFVLYRIGATKSGPKFWESQWYAFDLEASYRFDGSPARPQNVDASPHDLGFTPIVRISNTLASEGEPLSSVEPGIPIYKRIVDATFALQMIQRYGAFPQKWGAGGTLGEVRVAVDSLIHAPGENGEAVRFGTFEAADPTKMVAALEAHVKHLAAVLQVPPHYLLGAVVNMSAEGIAAAESGYHRNIGDRRAALGEGYELALRTGARILGDDAAAGALTDAVSWANVQSWSLAQVSDAISKLDVVGADLGRLFQMLPGWSRQDALESAGIALERRARLALAASSPSQPASQPLS